jgi:predicted phage terminase large subunit-like protein
MTESRNMKNGSKTWTPHQKAVIAATVYDNPYIPHNPFHQQNEFLLIEEEEGLYGGQAGGGKSDALLMAALQYVEEPDYAALILRRTYKDLSLPGALMDRANQWLKPTDAHWNGQDKIWTFPSGSTLTFGYLQHFKDIYNYQGSEFQFIAFDELTQFLYEEYSYLHSRLRRLEGSQIPIRMRAGSNPGGIGHQWVKDRFVSGELPFIPAGYKDNPYLDQTEYEKSLDKLDHITRQQLKYGNWDINPEGGLFKRAWFTLTENAPQVIKRCRAWDLAATIPKPGTDPDYTVGLLLGMTADNIAYVLDVQRIRDTPLEVEKLILQTAQLDGKETKIRIEQEGGSSGKFVIQDFSRKLMGYDFKGEPAKKSKEERAKPVSAAAENGNINVLNKLWASDFLDEVESFKTEGIHDDQVDALSLAFAELFEDKRKTWTVMG